MDTDPSVSTPNVRRIFTPDTETQVSITPPPTPISVHLLSPMQTSRCRPNTSPNFSTFGPSLGYKVPSTLISEHWQLLLQHYPNSRFPDILAGIIQHGARVGYEGPHVRIHGRNHSSAFRIPVEISRNIASEVAANRVVELHSLPQFYYLSPLGAVEKRIDGIRTGWRRIHDLSHPHGHSVNDNIAEAYGSLMYQTLEDAICF